MIVEVARKFVSPRLQQLIFGVITLLEFNGHISLILFGALLFYVLLLKIPKFINKILYLDSLYNGRPQIFQIFSLLPQVVLKYSLQREIMVVQCLEFLLGLNFSVKTPHLTVKNFLSHLLNVFFELLKLMAVELVNILKTLIQLDDMLSLNHILKIFIQYFVELHCEYLLL